MCVVLTRRVGTGGCLTGWLFSVKWGQVTGRRPHAHGALLLWLGGPAALRWGNGTPETGWRANAVPGTCNKTNVFRDMNLGYIRVKILDLKRKSSPRNMCQCISRMQVYIHIIHMYTIHFICLKMFKYINFKQFVVCKIFFHISHQFCIYVRLWIIIIL